MPTKPTPGSITEVADVQKDRVNNISNVSRAINQMQKDVDQKISETDKKIERKEGVQSIQNAMSQSVSKINQTIGALTTGVAKITTDTARATAGAITQYSKAISEDISFNKKSVVAMALAKTSPIYGYFVSKFMETNVWKQALTKMKTSISQTMGAILRPFKGGSARGAAVPQAQTGGHIAQGGLAKVHAGETITPAGGMDVGGIGSGELSELIDIQRQQLNYMQRTFGLERKYYRSWFQRMSPMRVIRAFRRTKGNYTAHLSTSERPMVNIAHNIATLYTQLMWRLDNMMEIQKANAIANRDLTTYFTGVTYPPIPGIRLRQLVKPLIRKIVGGIIKAAPKVALASLLATGAPWSVVAAIAGPVAVGSIIKRAERKKRKEAEARGEEYKPGFLSKRRGVYADYQAPGFKEKMRGRFRTMFPTGDMLQQPGEGLMGTRSMKPRPLAFNLDQKKLISYGKGIAIGFSEVFGGRKGIRKPIWVTSPLDKRARAYYRISAASDKKQTKALTVIKNTNAKHFSLQKKWIALRKKWRIVDWISKAVGFVGTAISSITKIIGNVVGGLLKVPLLGIAKWLGIRQGGLSFLKLAKQPLAKLFKATGGATGGLVKMLGPVVLGALTAAVVGGIIGTIINKWAGPKIQDSIDKTIAKSREARGTVGKRIESFSLEARKTAGRSGLIATARLKAHQFKPGKLSNDISLGKIQMAQSDFIMKHTDRYMKYPTDKFPEWREEWSKSKWALRVPLVNDAYEYGLSRERSFIEWVEKTKRNQILTHAEQRESVQRRSQAIGKLNPAAIAEAKKRQQAKISQIYSKPWKEQSAKEKLERWHHINRTVEGHLESSYGVSPSRAKQLTKYILESIPESQITLLDRPQDLLGYVDQSMSSFNELSSGKKTPQYEKEMFKRIGAQIKEGTIGKVNQNIIRNQEAGEMQKQADMIKDPIVAATNEVNQTIKDETKQSTVQLQSTTVQTSNQLNSTINDTTSMSGGGGRNRASGSDGWYQRAIFSGGR